MSVILVDMLLTAGVLILLMCAAGVLVMRNPYDRLHYASAAGWGALLVAIAIVASQSLSLIGDKALATALVLVVCGPVLAHATARAARIRDHGEWNDPHGIQGARDRKEHR